MELLFAKGKPLFAAPLKLIFLSEDIAATQAMFVVPKRLFKKAHDRNKLRRRMKEAYRLQKNEVCESFRQNGKTFLLAFLYTDKKPHPYRTLFESVGKLLAQLEKKSKI